ncbi:amidohydrolase family protein [Reichenbachiella carrageenanivorans]|uniref:Amidohydrolase family protein n=1 Tax=Reichenbachiella carrageenanivorans TaxID=2979869 RepID=A0ABY6D1S0_9BACT|nr:amidohydrolase family protein [Reichenbachiella carrageenanivorans]UXX79869.1 amidohydrolase family protein [Reichenbachiella carrageenanivorans]
MKYLIGITLAVLVCLFFFFSFKSINVEVWIKGGTIVDGTGRAAYVGDLAIIGDRIVHVDQNLGSHISAKTIVDARGLIVSPGFIDPHTHSIGDLKSLSRRQNLNYLTQGVTTVMNGNDGEGPYNVDRISEVLLANGIGTNTAFLVGHGTVREAVLGSKDERPDSAQLAQMKLLVDQGMKEGAFGLSAGLYYAPGSFSKTDEVSALAAVVKPYGGLYESHIRDESTYNIGLVAAIDEAITVGKEAGVPVHIAHIKALGVDVWGKSQEVIDLIENAQRSGVLVTADQYPWRASGTHLGNALLNRWVMADGKEAYQNRLIDERLLPKIRAELNENLRRRGGAEALLITADCWEEKFIAKNIKQIAEELQMSPEETVLYILRNGGARVASFNMNETDIKNFMQQPWVMTCSDGTKGHPRKYASFPEKYERFVLEDPILSLEEFVHRSSGLVAQTFGIPERGVLKEGFKADVLVWDAKNYKALADFVDPEKMSSGIIYAFVNGQLTIEQGMYTGALSGQVLRKTANK